MNDNEQRIRAAADRIYGETGQFPTVGQVRKEARSAMADAVDVMRMWRAEQRAKVHIAGQPVPKDLLAASAESAATIWSLATQIANASLLAAETAFEADKQDNVALAIEQAGEFDALLASHDEQARRAKNAEGQVEELEQRNADNIAFYESKVTEAGFRIRQHEDQLSTMEKLNVELRRELADERQACVAARENAAGLQGQLEVFRSR